MLKERDGRAGREELYGAIMKGAAERVRPIMMTVFAVIGGLLPIMWSTETGARVMKRIAAPMVGGMVSSSLLALIIVPIVYEMWRGWQLRHPSQNDQ
jgi:Cu(I)/Ag(I) efflux system membrane protein CusA/SilA